MAFFDLRFLDFFLPIEMERLLPKGVYDLQYFARGWGKGRKVSMKPGVTLFPLEELKCIGKSLREFGNRADGKSGILPEWRDRDRIAIWEDEKSVTLRNSQKSAKFLIALQSIPLLSAFRFKPERDSREKKEKVDFTILLRRSAKEVLITHF